jgi:hypothetical protein
MSPPICLRVAMGTILFSASAVYAQDATYVARTLNVPTEKQEGFVRNAEKTCLGAWKQLQEAGVLAEVRLFEVVRIDSQEKNVPKWNFLLLYHIGKAGTADGFIAEERDRTCLEKIAPFEMKREEVLRATPNSYYPDPIPALKKKKPTVEYWIEYIAVHDTPAALNEYRERARSTFGPLAAEDMREGGSYNFYALETLRVIRSARDMPPWNQIHVFGYPTGPGVPDLDCDAMLRKVNPGSEGCKAATLPLDAIRTKPRVDVARLVLEMD